MSSEAKANEAMWSISKRILFVVANLIIMVTVLACTILSLVEVSMLPDYYKLVPFQTPGSHLQCPTMADRIATAELKNPVAGYTTSISTNQTTQSLDSTTNSVSKREIPRETVKETARTMNNEINELNGKGKRKSYVKLQQLVLYFLDCFMPKQEGFSQSQLDYRSEVSELPTYVEELFDAIKRSLHSSIGTNIIAFFVALLAICAAILRTTTFLKMSLGLTAMTMLAELATVGLLFIGHGRTRSRNLYPNFDLLVESICQQSSLCVKPFMLVLIGILVCIAIACQVIVFDPFTSKEKPCKNFAKKGLSAYPFTVYPYGAYPAQFGDPLAMAVLPSELCACGPPPVYPPMSVHPYFNGNAGPGYHYGHQRPYGGNINIVS